MNADLTPLARYHHRGDATAFAELVQTHSGMVFAVARRITQDAALAEEVAQDTFLALARRGCAACDSIAAWLHHVSRQKALNAIRGEARRRAREREASTILHEATADSWHEIEPHVDELLEDLPENLRALLIEHYLEQRTQREIAQRHGLSQATVSRQVESGLKLLRDGLQRRGIYCGLALAAVLATQPAAATPVTLTASMSKLAMTGIGSAPTTTSTSLFTTAIVAMTTTTKILLGTAAVAVLSFPFLPTEKTKPVPATTVAEVKEPKPKPAKPKVSDKEAFVLLFGEGTEKLSKARRAVDEYRAGFPAKTLKELANDPSLTSRMANLMVRMSKDPDAFRGMGEAMQFAMSMKGIKPGPGVNINLNLGEALMTTESRAERYLGALLTDDAHALSDLFSDVVNEAAVEMAFDPQASTTSQGVSIQEGQPPQGIIIQQDGPVTIRSNSKQEED